MRPDISVSAHDAWTLLLCTMRYAMPRNSYMPSEAINLVIRYSDALTEHQLRQIAKEMDESIRLSQEFAPGIQFPDIIEDLRAGAAKFRSIADARVLGNSKEK